MNALSGAALIGAALFAVGDWVSRARADRRLEYACKPATLVALVVAAAALDPAADAGTRRAWFVAALVCSLAGDVLLMLPSDRFVAGLTAFLAAHGCYLAGFWADDPAAWALAASVVAVAAVVGPLGVRILRSVRASGPPELTGPVAGYVLVISAMLATAIATGNPLAGVGAALFAWSDTMIAWDRFVQPFSRAPVAIMVTYHLGQAGLVLSLLRF